MKLAVLILIAAVSMSAADRRAPGFSLPDGKLAQHDVADSRGKVLVIEFMRTDCPNCKTLSRELIKMKEKYGDKVDVLSIVNPPDSMTTVSGFIASEKITWPVLFDCGQAAASYAQITPDKPAMPLPQLFVVDQQGMIKLHVKGDGNPAELNSSFWLPAVDSLLKVTKK